MYEYISRSRTYERLKSALVALPAKSAKDTRSIYLTPYKT